MWRCLYKSTNILKPLECTLKSGEFYICKIYSIKLFFLKHLVLSLPSSWYLLILSLNSLKLHWFFSPYYWTFSGIAQNLNLVFSPLGIFLPLLFQYPHLLVIPVSVPLLSLKITFYSHCPFFGVIIFENNCFSVNLFFHFLILYSHYWSISSIRASICLFCSLTYTHHLEISWCIKIT